MNYFAAVRNPKNRWLYNRLVFKIFIGTRLANYIDKNENYGGV